MKSLCASIPSNEGIKTKGEVHDGHPTKTVATKVFTTILRLMLTQNNFFLNSKSYLNNGMHNTYNLCPAYANIFIAQFEKQHIYQYIKNKSIPRL